MASRIFAATETEIPNAISVERDFLVGCFLGMFAYGIHVTLYIISMIAFYSTRKANPKANWIYMAYITFNFVLSSIGNALNTLLGVQAFVTEQNRFSGGPAAFVASIDTLAVTQASFIVYTINTWSQDGLLLYRFYVIFGECFRAVVIPFCLYLAAIVCSCVLMARLTTPGDFSRAEETLHFGIVFWAISIGTTMLLTLLIVIRLIMMRFHTKKAMNECTATPYLSVSATLMESAFLYSVVGGIYLVFYAEGSLTQYLLLEVLGQVTSIAPLLIAWRVAHRRAWTSNTLQLTTKPTVIFFKGEQEGVEFELSGITSTSSTVNGSQK